MSNLNGRKHQHEPLTQKRVDSASPQAREYTLWDSKVRGLGLRIRPTGVAQFYVYYRFGRQQRKYKIGNPSVLSLDDARREAKRVLGKVALGDDPAAHRADTRSITFEEAYREYQAAALPRLAPSYRHWINQRFSAELLPKLSKVLLSRVTKGDIRKISNAAIQRGAPSEANNIHRSASAFLSWCKDQDHIQVNPIYGMNLPAKQKSRTRYLKREELLRLWHACNDLGPIWGSAIRMLILTGQRKNEVLRAEISEFDLDKATWNIPASRTKNGSDHTVHLCQTAIEVVRAIPCRDGQKFLFQSPVSRKSTDGQPKVQPLTGLNHKVSACTALNGIHDWCIHDIRRSVATHMAALKIPQHIVEVVLNHRSGFRSGVAGIYNRYGYHDESRDAWNTWGAALNEWLITAQDGSTTFCGDEIVTL